MGRCIRWHPRQTTAIRDGDSRAVSTPNFGKRIIRHRRNAGHPRPPTIATRHERLGNLVRMMNSQPKSWRLSNRNRDAAGLCERRLPVQRRKFEGCAAGSKAARNKRSRSWSVVSRSTLRVGTSQDARVSVYSCVAQVTGTSLKRSEGDRSPSLAFQACMGRTLNAEFAVSRSEYQAGTRSVRTCVPTRSVGTRNNYFRASRSVNRYSTTSVNSCVVIA